MRKIITLTALLWVNMGQFAQADVQPSETFLALTQAHQHYKQQSIEPQENGYLFELGLFAPKTETLVDIEQKVLAWAQAVKADTATALPYDSDFWLLGDNFHSLDKVLSLCVTAELAGCPLSHYEGLAYALTHEYDWLLKRYAKLLSYKKYQRISNENNADFSLFSSPRIHNFYLASLWLKRYDMEPEALKAALQADYRFQTMRLSAADTLLEKMIAANSIESHYFWLNELLKSVDKPTAKQLVDFYEKQPLPSEALSMRRALIGEFMFMHEPPLEQLKKPLTEGEKQSMANNLAVFAQALLDIEASKDTQIALKEKLQDPALQEAAEALKTQMQALIKEELLVEEGLSIEMLLQYPVYYIQSLRELPALPKAVQLLSAIRQSNLSAEQIPAFLAQTDNLNPVTGQPYEWESETNAIYTQGVDGYLRLHDEFDLGIVFEENMPDNFYQQEHEEAVEDAEPSSCSPK